MCIYMYIYIYIHTCSCDLDPDGAAALPGSKLLEFFLLHPQETHFHFLNQRGNISGLLQFLFE